jgi:hypothetical protein
MKRNIKRRKDVRNLPNYYRHAHLSNRTHNSPSFYNVWSARTACDISKGYERMLTKCDLISNVTVGVVGQDELSTFTCQSQKSHFDIRWQRKLPFMSAFMWNLHNLCKITQFMLLGCLILCTYLCMCVCLRKISHLN